AFHRRSGRWPNRDSGKIVGMLGLTWCAVDLALKNAGRGLPGNSSLSQLLAEHRSVRNRMRLPKFSIKQILAWADTYFKRHRRWPTTVSGPVEGAPGENWSGVSQALRHGNRGLPDGSSLAKLLASRRGARTTYNLPHLSEKLVLRWADAF